MTMDALPFVLILVATLGLGYAIGCRETVKDLAPLLNRALVQCELASVNIEKLRARLQAVSRCTCPETSVDPSCSECTSAPTSDG